MTAFCKQISHFFAVDLNQKVIQNYKRRFALRVAVLFGMDLLLLNTPS
jgi:hypothetical protein